MADEIGHGDGTTSGGLRPGALTDLLRQLVVAPLSDSEAGDWDGGLYAGAVIGRFELVRELGHGGFGVVWEARDRELGRRVAFKAVRAGAHRELREERLVREAEAAAQLSHANIVTLYDVGRSESGPYLILELLEGKTVARRLREGRLTLREAVHVGAEVARGLAHAHAHGVVHRDLKPENVFLCRDGSVKVLDFGLAQAFGRRSEAGGTRGYMAPEQIEGAPEDERTDVWALGVMLFELLSGRRPFDDDSSVQKGAPAIHVPGLPALEQLIGRMLATRPPGRPRDGGEVLEALAAIEQEVARTPSAAVQARIRRRTRVPWVPVLLAAVALGAAIATGAWWSHEAGRSSSVASPSGPVALAVLPLANLSGDAAKEYFSDGMTEEITGKLSRLSGLAVTPRSSVARYKGSQKDARDIGRELGVAYVIEGSVRRAGDRIRVVAMLVRTSDAVQIWSDSIDARLDDVFDVQERVAKHVVDALHVRLSRDEAGSLARWGTRNAVAYDKYLRGYALVERYNRRENIEAARGHFERALQIDPSFAPAMAGLAFAEAVTYRDFDSNRARLTTARTLLDGALSIDPRLPGARMTSALIRAVSYDYRGAAEDFRRAAALEPRSYSAWDGVCWMLAYVTPPELAEAETACRRSIELYPGFVEAEFHLTRVLALQGRTAEAEQMAGRLAEHAPGSPFLYTALFWVHLGSNRPRAALEALGKAPVVTTPLGRAFTSMALAQAGDLDGAFASLEDALKGGYRDADGLRGGPDFEPLRRDPRFSRLLASFGIAAPRGAPGPGQAPGTKR